MSAGTCEPLKTVNNIHQDDVHGLIHWNRNLCTGSKDTTVKIWDKELNLLQTLRPPLPHAQIKRGYEHWVTSLGVSPNDQLLCGTRFGMISAWDNTFKLKRKYYFSKYDESNDPICKQRNKERIMSLCNLLGTSDYFLSGAPTKIQVRHSQTLKVKFSFKVADNDWPYVIKHFQDHSYLAAVGSDLQMWRISVKGEFIHKKLEEEIIKEKEDEIIGRQRPLISSIERINGSTVALACFTGAIKFLDFEKREYFSYLDTHKGRVWGVLKVEDQTLASCGEDGYVKLWDLRNNMNTFRLGKHSGRVSNIEMLGEKHLLAASCPKDIYHSEEKACFTLWDLRKL